MFVIIVVVGGGGGSMLARMGCTSTDRDIVGTRGTGADILERALHCVFDDNLDNADCGRYLCTACILYTRVRTVSCSRDKFCTSSETENCIGT